MSVCGYDGWDSKAFEIVVPSDPRHDEQKSVESGRVDIPNKKVSIRDVLNISSEDMDSFMVEKDKFENEVDCGEVQWWIDAE